MSTHSTLVTEEHFAYLAARTHGEDDFLRDLTRAAEAAGIPAISIAPEQASLMQILLKLAGAPHVVEGGTLAVKVGQVFSLDQIVEAHDCMENNRAGGKIVILT